MNRKTHFLKHSDILKNYIDEKNISVTQIAKLLGYTRPSIYDKFLSKDEFTNDQIYVLHTVLGISTKLFGKTYNDVAPDFIEKEGKQSQFMSYNVSRKKGTTYSSFLRSYFEPIIMELKNAQESIVVVDSLTENWHIGSKINAETGDDQSYVTFQELYKEYLEELEKAIIRCLDFKKKSGHKKPVYRRVLQLPLKPCVFKPSDYDSGALNWVYVETISHINRLYKKYEKSSKSKISKVDAVLEKFHLLENDHIEFYVLPQPMRQYSFMIIDDRTIITEYLKINKQGEHYPDIIFIQDADKNDPSDIIYQMLQSYNYQIDTTLNSKYALNLSPIHLKSKLELLVNDYEKQIVEKGQNKDSILSQIDIPNVHEGNGISNDSKIFDTLREQQLGKIREELNVLSVGYKIAQKKLALFK